MKAGKPSPEQDDLFGARLVEMIDWDVFERE